MTTKFKFNDEQQQVINCTDKNILCLAGAGAGKTACLVQRLRRLVSEGTNPRRILVLTFTNAAAFEMQERCKQQANESVIPEFCTFHAFCYKLLAVDHNFRKALGYSQTPQIITEEAYKAIYTKLKNRLKLKVSDSDFLYKPDNREVKLLREALEQELCKTNLITFDILITKVSKLFIDGSEICSKYFSFYTDIFVDEFQDTDPLQWGFVSSFESANKFIVGDALQSIYAFRGADNSIIKSLSDNKDWTCIKLHHNYRSTKPICEYANAVGKSYADDMYRVNMISDVAGVDVKHIAQFENKFTDSIEALESLVPDIKVPGKTVALLARTNSEVAELRSRLSSLGLTISTNQIDDINIHLLNSVLSDEYKILWLSSLLPKEMYSEFLRISAIEEVTSEDFDRYYYDVYPIREYIPIINSIKQLKNEGSLGSVASKISIKLHIPLCVCECNTFDELINYMICQLSESQISELYVGTIHSVKGLEYDSVVLFGVDGSHFKLRGEQNKNLFYVGVTRAKTNLTIIGGDII